MKCEQDLGFEHVNSPCALAPDLQPCVSSLQMESWYGEGMDSWTVSVLQEWKRALIYSGFLLGDDILPCIYSYLQLNA